MEREWILGLEGLSEAQALRAAKPRIPLEVSQRSISLADYIPCREGKG